MKFHLPPDRRRHRPRKPRTTRPDPDRRTPDAGPGDPVEIAAAELRRHDGDRFVTALAAPMPNRRGLFSVYAFNLELARTRESVSEPMLGEIRLQWWRDSIEELFLGAAKRHVTLQALADCHARTPLSRAHLDALIDARGTDLFDEQIRSLAELEDYAAGTSSRVVHLALEALGVSDIAAHAAGRHVGIAWALIGLLRAVPFHAAQRRLYLPLALLSAAGLSPDDVYGRRDSPALAEIVAEIAGIAAGHLGDARALAPAVPAEARPALLPAVLAERYLFHFQRRRYAPFGPPLELGLVERPLQLMLASRRGRY